MFNENKGTQRKLTLNRRLSFGLKLSTSLAVFACAAVFGVSAHAQTTTNIAGGSNIGTVVPLPVTNGDSWNLQGNGSYLINNIALPAAGAGLTINGNDNTLNLNNGASYGKFTGNGVTLTLNDVIIANGSQTSGGAINSTGTTTLTGALVTLANNNATSSNGGGIFSSQTVTVNGNLTANTNTAKSSGGAIYGFAGDVVVHGSMTANGNTAGGYGGAIHANGNNTTTNARLTVDNSISMDGNRAGASGGAITMFGGTSLITLAGTSGNVSLTNNSSVNKGGAIWAQGQIIVGNVDGNVSFIGNSTTSTVLGGIGQPAAHGGVMSIDAIGATAATNAISIRGANIDIKNNTATGSGGAIYASNGSVLINGAFTASGNKATGQSGSSGGTSNQDATTGQGGVIKAAAGNIVIDASVSTDGTINKGITLDGNSASAIGGALYANGNISLAATDGDVYLTRNTAGNGGAIYASGTVSVGNAGSIVSIGVDSSGNAAGNTTTGGFGGGIGAAGAITITGSAVTISNNGAYGGGGIYISSAGNSALVINGNLTANNNYSYGSGYPSGGGIAFTYGDMTVNGSVAASSNLSGRSGGGFFSVNGAVNLAATTGNGNVSLTNNIATGGGGAIWGGATGRVSVNIGNSAGTVTITDNRAGDAYTGPGNPIAANANALGGAIVANGTVVLTGTAIDVSRNQATGNGGAIYTMTGVTANGDLTLKNNTSVNGNGGAIFSGSVSYPGNVQINNGLTVSGNSAGLGGGAMYLDRGNLIVVGNAGMGILVDSNIAKNGAGGAFLVANGTLSLAGSGNVSLTNNIASGNGGAASASSTSAIGNNGGTVTLTGNKAGYDAGGNQLNITSSGGGIYSGGATTVNASSASFADNHASSNGGGVYSGGAVTINASSVSFAGNRALQHGGGLYSGGITTINSSISLTDNRASQNGGAIYSVQFINLNNNVVAHDNQALNGGVVYSQTGAINASRDVNAYKNTALNGNGGAFASNSSQVNIANSSGSLFLTGNTASANGGAVYAASSSLIGNNAGTVTITGNTAGGSGGAVYDAATATLNGTAIQLSNNVASVNGGGIYSGSGATVNGALEAKTNRAQSGGAVYAQSGNILTQQDVNADGNIASNGFGGAFAANSGDVTLAQTSGASSLTNNTASANGGAVYAGGAAKIGNSNGTVSLTGNRSGFDATGTALNTTSNGGAVASGGAATFTGASVTMSTNIATGNGGAVYGGQGATFNGNLSAHDNTAQNGGLVYAQTNGITASRDVDVHDNTATNGNGGAFAANSGIVSLAQTNGTVSLKNNEATGNGGAVYSGSNVFIGNNAGAVTVAGNSAEASGGAIYGVSSLTMAGSTITLSNNIAALNGGGVYVGQNATINNGLIAETNRAENGGAIYAQSGAITTTGSVSADANVATTGFGGAFAANSGNVTLAQTSGAVSLTNNTAATNGGAVYGSTVRVGNAAGAVTLTGNSATGTGGAVFANSAAILTANTFSITNNAATSGGAVQAASASVTGALTATGNIARTGNGGVINATSGAITTSGALAVTGNNAGGAGGAFSAFSDVSLTNARGTFSNNIAQTGAGAIYANGGFTLSTVAAMDISGNRTNEGVGGAIAAQGPVSLTSGNGELTLNNNSAAGLVGAKGGAIWAGDDVTLNASGGNISFAGNTHGDPIANAIWLANINGGATATFNANAGNTVTFFDPIANDAAKGLINVTKTGDGAVIFDASRYNDEVERWSKVFADTRVEAGTFEVSHNAVYGAFASDAATATAPTSFTTAANSVLAGGVVSSLRADSMVLNGDIKIAGQHPEVRGVMNLNTANLTFGGGTVHFNTFLDDGSSQNTDRLVLNLNGTATSGQALISVNAVGGDGAQTFGDGIRIVQTNNGTSDGAFILASRVASGIYEYNLYQGGFAPTGGDPNDQHWYLRNTIAPPPPPPTPDPGPGPAPAPAPSPAPTPNIRVEVPVDMSVQPLAIEYGYALLNTLHERAGDARILPQEPVVEERIVWCKDAAQNFKCVVRVPVATGNGAIKNETRWGASGWAKLFGDRGIRDRGSFARYGADYDYTLSGIQAGLDVYAHEQADGTLDKAGIYVGYGQITSNVKGQFGGHAGSVDMDAYSLAGYWTHHAPQGWYTDAVIQGTWYAANAHSVLGQQIKPDGFGIVGSLEGGYTFKLGSGWTIEPQAQVVYQHVSFDNARDAFGVIRFDDGESLRARLGVRVTKSWNMAEDANPRLVTAWLRANVWHEFLGKTQTSIGALDGRNMVPFTGSLGGTWGEIGAGVTAQISDNVNLFATGAYSRSLDNKGRQGWDGRLGVNVKW